MTTYDTPESFRAAWQVAQRAAKRPRKATAPPEAAEPTTTTTTTRKLSPVERLASAGYMISVETAAGEHYFCNKDGDKTPAGADYAEARRLALRYIGETS